MRYLVETKTKRLTHIDAVYSLDFETDPFKYGRIPKPFVCEIYNGVYSHVIWEENPQKMNEAIMSFLEAELESLQLEFKSPSRGKLRNMYVYAHNGGKFDFFFMLPLFRDAKLKMIGSRLAEAKLTSKPMIFRDSFCIIPTGLANAGDKFIFDYRKMEKECRNNHKQEILEYLHQDVVVLGDMVYNFNKEFGFNLTIASTGMKKLTELYPRIKSPDARLCEFEHDHWATKAYFGGHVECFASGKVLPKKKGGTFKVYDYNSMYPYVMANFEHPLDNKCHVRTEKGIMRKEYDSLFCEDTFFVNFDGMLNGCVPVRNEENHCIDYPHGYVKQFTISIHEYRIAVKYGFIKVDRVNYTENFKNKTTFKAFVDEFYGRRKVCKETGDDQRALFFKFILNAPYGKFAIDPRKYGSHYITEEITDKEYYAMLEDKAVVIDTADRSHFMVVTPPDDEYTPGRNNFYNVITAASITAAARSVLMEGLAWADNPVYCDTDSIICEGLKPGHPLRIHKSELGALDLEAEGDVFYCAGKKMYALFDGDRCVKMASKGMNLKPEDIWPMFDEMTEQGASSTEIYKAIGAWQKDYAGNIIMRVAQGESVVSVFDAPTLSVCRGISFTRRTVRNTAKIYANHKLKGTNK